MKNIFFAILIVSISLLNACNEKVNSNNNKHLELLDTNKVSTPFVWEKINESGLGSCHKISKEQLAKIEKVLPILFKQYSKINEFNDCLEFVYNDFEKYAQPILDFISVERVCCPSYTYYMKTYPDKNQVSLVVGGSPKIKELAKDYTKE
jgi:hypothetical protein